MTERSSILVFITCSVVIVWVYFGYPVALRCGLLGRRKPIKRAASTPSVSVIIPAHNEEAGIEAKLRNLLAADYPREQVEILVGSDGSSDRTQEIVERFASEGVRLLSFPEQRGKSAIQNGLVAVASGSILVFTDADCLLSTDALRLLAENFADPCVGLVTAIPHYLNVGESATTANEGVYLVYETWLRQAESERGLLVMASGSLFAARRSLWQPLDPNLGDDFALPLRVMRAGLRNVLDSRTAAITRLTQNGPSTMLRLKTRIISKDFKAILTYRTLLNPFTYGRIAVALWSHKLLRWLVPYFLAALFVSNLFLVREPSYRILLAFQLCFYLVAAVGLVRRHTRSWWWSILSIPTSFCVVNFAALMGTLKCWMGRTAGIWTPDRVPSTSDAPFPRRTRAD